MQLPDQMLKDGNLSFEGGADASRPPSTLARNQFVFATNSTTRGGKSRQRPALIPRHLSFPNDTLYQAFRSGGRFQHADFYNGLGEPMLISSHGGRLFSVRVRDWKVSEITPSGGRNSAALTRGWSCSAENYWIYQDNQSRPVIFDGVQSTRTVGDAQVPVGNAMAYTMGRLIVALPDQHSFRAGDLVFGDGQVSDMLDFTENNYLNEGGDFVARVYGAPSGHGPIRALKAMAMNDTSLGQGPLVVGTPGVVFSVNLPFDRTAWKNLSNPLQTVNPILGPVAQDSTILVNGDLWYRSVDGIRSYIQAQRDFLTYANTPVSRELGDLLSQDNPALLEYGSAAFWNNYAMWTVSPRKSTMGIYHTGLAVINFDGVSNLRGRTPPAWDGLWTGLKVLKVLTGVVNNQQRCFVYALNEDDEIELWEFDPTGSVVYDGETCRVQREVELPSYNFSRGFDMLRLETGELFIEDVQGEVDITVRYRPDQHPCWIAWHTFSDVCAQMTDCTVPDPNTGCVAPKTLHPQFRSKLRLSQPGDSYDAINARKYRTGYEFQTRIEITGHATINKARFLAGPEKESPVSERIYR